MASLLLPLILLATPTNALLQQSRPTFITRNQFRSRSGIICHATPEVVAAGAVVVAGGAAILWASGSEERAKRAQYAEWEARDEEERLERARLAYMEPRETWKESELSEFDGTQDENGPLLFSAGGRVFNVWKGRHFYGPGCEYHIFAGRDATRLLAKSQLEEETDEERALPLNIGQRAALEGWLWTFKNKYEIVGHLEGYNPKDIEM
eukprot:CAMPEP_0198301296 /NCGR_PEP_ID=MMETSP1449-20131203/51023_1 /TAXON_ID=420275 /ORGANISM="Attheya septentrionalis, Strain CCMP2084" /LENGTH=207 /DNA_ID=CAMNT_0044003335 /DNA_START=43 /DNA_END=666 /DNA_ORIENTATION=-